MQPSTNQPSMNQPSHLQVHYPLPPRLVPVITAGLEGTKVLGAPLVHACKAHAARQCKAQAVQRAQRAVERSRRMGTCSGEASAKAGGAGKHGAGSIHQHASIGWL